MKKTILFILCLIFIGCAVDPEMDITGVDQDEYDLSKNLDNEGINVKGDGNIINNNYFDASRKSMTIKSDTIMLRDTTIIRDTVIYKEEITKRDTLIKHDTLTVTDTKIITKVDTVLQTNVVYDTVETVKTDTIVKNVVDTLYKTKIDTVYLRPTIIEEEPKDTTITLSKEIDGILYTKSYDGIVYKNVFYEAKEYQLGFMSGPDVYNPVYFYIPEGYVTVGDFARESNCSGACGIRGNVYLGYQCGEISKPDYYDIAYRDVKEIKKFDGWRVFDDIDAYEVAKYLNKIVSDTTLVYLSTIEYEQTIRGTFTANVAKYKVPSMVSKNADKLKIKYICAYDLQ